MSLASRGSLKLSGKASCASCWNWLPHVHYPFIGYCSIWLVTTFDDYYCLNYEPVSVSGDRFYWCSTCKLRLTRDDAIIHWNGNHRIFRAAYVDPDVREELYEG
ncbi:MAG: hypothetical protein QXE41_05280 [Acidilobaceae archaeon]